MFGKLQMEAEKNLKMVYLPNLHGFLPCPTLPMEGHVEVSWSIWWVFHVGIPCPGTTLPSKKGDEKSLKPTPTQHQVVFCEKESFDNVEEEFLGTGGFQSKKMLRHRRFFRKYSEDV